MAEGLFLRDLLEFLLKRKVDIYLWSDSSTSLGTLSRIGSGHLKHVEVKHLWLQQQIRMQRIFLKFVPGSHNAADLLTKGLPPDLVERHRESLGYSRLLDEDR